MQKLDVYTKRMPSGTWSCYTTYKGQDKAFTDEKMEPTQTQMRAWLEGEPIEVIWHDPVIHKKNEEKQDLSHLPGFHSNKIDHSPFA